MRNFSYVLFPAALLIGASLTAAAGLSCSPTAGSAESAGSENTAASAETHSSAEEQKGSGKGLELQVDGIQSSEGRLLVLVFASGEGFPDNDQAAVAQMTQSLAEAQPEEGTLRLQLPDQDAGSYAVTVLHDANGNGKMDTNALGIPQEGYGVSNGAKRAMAPPRFDDAVVDWAPGQALTVTVSY